MGGLLLEFLGIWGNHTHFHKANSPQLHYASQGLQSWIFIYTSMCCNSSFKTRKQTLMFIFDKLIKLKIYQEVLMFNTSKAYNSLKTGLAERHLCRLWYHDCQDEDWRI